MLEYQFSIFWDDETSIWVADSQDLPGHVVENISFDTLIEQVKASVSELLELSGKENTQVKILFKAERSATVLTRPAEEWYYS